MVALIDVHQWELMVSSIEGSPSGGHFFYFRMRNAPELVGDDIQSAKRGDRERTAG